jgi:hypothetical protein
MEKIELVCTTSTSRQQSEVAKREINDCVVRAFSAAFEVPYDMAHHFCAVTFKRKPGGGTFGARPYLVKTREVFGKQVVELGEPAYPNAGYNAMFTYYTPPKKYWGEEKMIQRAMTVKTFLKQFAKGSYLVFVAGHVFTVKNGVVYGNVEDAKRMRSRVWAAFQVK